MCNIHSVGPLPLLSLRRLSLDCICDMLAPLFGVGLALLRAQRNVGIGYRVQCTPTYLRPIWNWIYVEHTWRQANATLIALNEHRRTGWMCSVLGPDDVIYIRSAASERRHRRAKINMRNGGPDHYTRTLSQHCKCHRSFSGCEQKKN